MRKIAFPWDEKKYSAQLRKAALALTGHFGPPPEIGIIFGSGLGEEFFQKARPRKVLPFKKVPFFSPPTVAGHQGRIYCVPGRSASALVLQGRCHFYEGYAPEQVVFPLRAMTVWGIRRWVITNAAGSLNPRLKAGDLVWIKDHLNFTGANPLRGPNLEWLGPRFPSLQGAYDGLFSKRVRKTAKSAGIVLKAGSYVGIGGPSYETEAEIHAFRRLGGDLVGMSTVLEVIAAAHAGCDLIALSAVTNSCLKGHRPLRHEEVLRNAKRVDQKITRVLQALIKV